MTQGRFYFLTGAFITLCIVFAAVSVPSTAFVIKNEAEFKNRFKRLLLQVDLAFSFDELQCPDNTSENVKACIRRINADIPHLPSFCDWFSRFTKCFLGGYDECANGNSVAVILAKDAENESSELGCTEDAHAESKKQSKREAGNELERVSKFRVIEAALSQLVSTFN